MYLAGVDLAWNCHNNGSGLAFGILEAGVLRLLEARSGIIGLRAVEARLASYPALRGLAIDAPLIINNLSGQRACERLLAQRYASRKAACHPSNLSLYPDAASVQLARNLHALGFRHAAGRRKFQLECYPHPALIEIFGLQERLLYKKGRVQEKRDGQVELAALLGGLECSSVLPLRFDDKTRQRLTPDFIQGLRGQHLKDNEDRLDAVVCLYIAALFASKVDGEVFGTTTEGYIFVPQVDCR